MLDEIKVFDTSQPITEEWNQHRLSLNALHKQSALKTEILSPEEFTKKVTYTLNGMVDNGGYEPDTHIASDTMVEELLIALGYKDAVETIRSFNRWYD